MSKGNRKALSHISITFGCAYKHMAAFSHHSFDENRKQNPETHTAWVSSVNCLPSPLLSFIKCREFLWDSITYVFDNLKLNKCTAVPRPTTKEIPGILSTYPNMHLEYVCLEWLKLEINYLLIRFDIYSHLPGSLITFIYWQCLSNTLSHSCYSF